MNFQDDRTTCCSQFITVFHRFTVSTLTFPFLLISILESFLLATMQFTIPILDQYPTSAKVHFFAYAVYGTGLSGLSASTLSLGYCIYTFTSYV